MVKPSHEFDPLSDFVLIRIHGKDMTSGGVAIPESASGPEPEQGTVLAVGPGYLDHVGNLVRPTLEPGDVVHLLFISPSPIAILWQGQKCYIAREREIIARDASKDSKSNGSY